MKTYYIKQKITAFANQYRIYEADGDQPGRLIAFAQQKRLAIKEKFLFYTDESKQQLAFSVQARNIMELAGTYDVRDEHEQVLGVLQKQFQASLLRSTWQIQSADQSSHIATVQERSIPIAVMRRVWSFVPYIGDLPFFMLYHFDFLKPGGGEILARYNKITLLRDHYRLEIEDDLADAVDWRVLVAQGVALDALQSR
jgi:uncharacterized protein YxjI